MDKQQLFKIMAKFPSESGRQADRAKAAHAEAGAEEAAVRKGHVWSGKSVRESRCRRNDCFYCLIIKLLSLLTSAIDSVQQSRDCIVASLLLCESWGSLPKHNASSLIATFATKDAGTRPTITMTTDQQSNGDLVVEHPTAPGDSSPNATKRKRADSDKTQPPQSQLQAQLFQDLLELLNTSVASATHHPGSVILTLILGMIPRPRSCTCL